MTMTDIELAENARDGDRNALRQLVERHYDSAYRVALRMTGSVTVRAPPEGLQRTYSHIFAP